MEYCLAFGISKRKQRKIDLTLKCTKKQDDLWYTYGEDIGTTMLPDKQVPDANAH